MNTNNKVELTLENKDKDKGEEITGTPLTTYVASPRSLPDFNTDIPIE